MAHRTFAIGDIHGGYDELTALVSTFPALDAADTIVFIGDYTDRGPKSAEVIDYIRHQLPRHTPAKIVALRGSHEDAWLRVRSKGWLEFILPVGNGCLATLRSFTGRAASKPGELATAEDYKAMLSASFFPADVIAWMESLPAWYEDDHAIYVHAGLPRAKDGRWLHPSEVTDPTPLFWERSEEFFRSYRGKRVVFGHTIAPDLPQELSAFTPDDKTDMYFNDWLAGIDTRCGHGGFLTAIELPGLIVYESRRAAHAAR